MPVERLRRAPNELQALDWLNRQQHPSGRSWRG